MTGFLPAYIAKQHVDGITVRAKDSATQFVQFFYREWITDAKGTHYAGPANQVSDWQEQKYDATTTYTKAQQVYYTDSSGKFGEWLSIANGNKGNAPPVSPEVLGSGHNRWLYIRYPQLLSTDRRSDAPYLGPGC